MSLPPPPPPTYSLNRFGKWAIFATLASSKRKVEGLFPRKTKHGWAWLSIWLGTRVSTHYTEPIVFIAAAPNPHAKCGFTRLCVCVIGLTKEMAGPFPLSLPPPLYPPSLPTSSLYRQRKAWSFVKTKICFDAFKGEIKEKEILERIQFNETGQPQLSLSLLLSN